MDLTDHVLSSGIKQLGVRQFIEQTAAARADTESQDLPAELKRNLLYSHDRILELGLAAYAKRYKNGAAEIAAAREVMQ